MLFRFSTGVSLKVLGVVLLALGAAGTLPLKAAGDKETERLARAREAFREIMAAPDNTIPQNLLDRSICVAVIPGMVKAGFIFGGRYGRGAVSCRSHQGTGPWGAPCMVLLGGGSFGLQIGGAGVDVVMLVMNPSGIDRLLQDKFSLGADASAAAGPVGRAASAETDAQMSAKILTYSRSRGVFAGLELKGAVLKQDRRGNQNLYGKEIDARQLLLEGQASLPPAARAFIDELARVSSKQSKKPF